MQETEHARQEAPERLTPSSSALVPYLHGPPRGPARGIVVGGRFVCMACAGPTLALGYWPAMGRLAQGDAWCAACGRYGDPDHIEPVIEPVDTELELAIVPYEVGPAASPDDRDVSSSDGPAPRRGFPCALF